MKKILNYIFIDGLSGMALGLFATLIIGTIIKQVGSYIPGFVGTYLVDIGQIASSITGAGIGCGVAVKFKEKPLVIFSAAVCGMIGAFASSIIAGTIFVDGVIAYKGPGEPLGAYIAALVGITLGRMVAGKTKLDILVTPSVTILSGAFAGILLGPPISGFMTWLGGIVNWSTERQPLLMGILVSVIMGMVLTLPISSAALGLILNLSGLAAGAATVGCCANMVGFAVASFKYNGWGGLFAQGLGTSMLQVPNIMKKPVIWLPAIISSAILGPVGTLVFKMTNNATGSGMGTSGLVGQLMTYQDMTATGASPVVVTVKIIVLHFLLPAALSFGISELMRRRGWIKPGDMKLDLE
ncbi:MAG: PTS sugar transporter subunit IIC [Lachnospiraceae bacterium]|nr:PTS sugar transporter subunit IIC [Lachnospiraceae bacterium]